MAVHDVLTKGQVIAELPREHTQAFLTLFQAHFTGYETAFLADSNALFVVYPPLSDEELEKWRALCREERTRLGV